MHTIRLLIAANGFISRTYHTCHTHQRAFLQHSELACHKRCPGSHIQHAPWALCRFGWHRPWSWSAFGSLFHMKRYNSSKHTNQKQTMYMSIHMSTSHKVIDLLLFRVPIHGFGQNLLPVPKLDPSVPHRKLKELSTWQRFPHNDLSGPPFTSCSIYFWLKMSRKCIFLYEFKIWTILDHGW